jgi:Zn-dependent peptidase ImmA (M78 family)
VAEELAHVHLHRQVIGQVDSPAGFQQLHNQIVGTRGERNAKRFAAALLMPVDKLGAEAGTVYRQLVQRVGTDHPEPVLKWLCSLLAQKFRVNEAAMGIRLKELGVNEKVRWALQRGYSNLPG